jgi:hypothetical protein
VGRGGAPVQGQARAPPHLRTHLSRGQAAPRHTSYTQGQCRIKNYILHIVTEQGAGAKTNS